MSDHTTDYGLLVFGYIRWYQKLCFAVIPPELYTIVLMFYPRKYKLFGIGEDLLGLSPEEQHKNSYEKKRWYYLSTMSSLCLHPSFVSCANNNFFIRNMNNEIYAIGNNLYGSLGVGSYDVKIDDFRKVKFKNHNAIFKNYILDIKSKGTFTSHTFVVLKNITTNSQKFYGFGKNSAGQQGFKPSDSTRKQNHFPTSIPVLNSLFKKIQVIQISTGHTHSLFITAKGRVYSCGDNTYGQCGIICGDFDSCLRPQIVPLLYGITDICCGQYHNLCIDKNNRVWVFGENNSHQLGLGEEYKKKHQSDIAVMNPYFTGDTKDNKIIFVECGDNFSLCISENGKAYMFGANDLGQCGNGEDDDVYIPFCIQKMKEFKNILFESGSLGVDYSQLISYCPDNNLYGFGSNSCNQTGNLNEIDAQLVPYLCKKTDIGIDNSSKIVGVFCDEDVTVVMCEIQMRA